MGRSIIFMLSCLRKSIRKSNTNLWINLLNGNTQCFMRNIKINIFTDLNNARSSIDTFAFTRCEPILHALIARSSMPPTINSLTSEDVSGRNGFFWAIIRLFKWLSVVMNSSAYWTGTKHLIHQWMDPWCIRSCSLEYEP